MKEAVKNTHTVVGISILVYFLARKMAPMVYFDVFIPDVPRNSTSVKPAAVRSLITSPPGMAPPIQLDQASKSSGGRPA